MHVDVSVSVSGSVSVSISVSVVVSVSISVSVLVIVFVYVLSLSVINGEKKQVQRNGVLDATNGAFVTTHVWKKKRHKEWLGWYRGIWLHP